MSKRNLIAILLFTAVWLCSIFLTYKVTAYTEYDKSTIYQTSSCNSCGGSDGCVWDATSGKWIYL